MVKNMAATDTKNLGSLATGSVMAMLLSAGLMGNAAIAQHVCEHLTRSYLISVMDGQTLVSRQVLTLTADANAFVVDSNQGGRSGAFNPFSSERDSWACQSIDPDTATAILHDFRSFVTVVTRPRPENPRTPAALK